MDGFASRGGCPGGSDCGNVGSQARLLINSCSLNHSFYLPLSEEFHSRYLKEIGLTDSLFLSLMRFLTSHLPPPLLF